ncbi:hypothetical protein DVS28_b0285 (plasmid) [Euzebya pacifica]|uniref:Homeodomain-like domain-containing protein n=2 Tax=Euzebya pacifica TaxID=1608957 RepID=A0A346Y6F8_9ACTN|nr:hypothetical protein DVS28_b0285 [Euzebya pacifica]
MERRRRARELLADGDWMYTQVSEGRTARQIAVRLGVSAGAVNSWLRRHDLVIDVS